MQLSYKNLGVSKYEKIVIDSLLYFDTDHEPFEKEDFEEELRVKNKYVKIKPSVSVGMEYTLRNKIQVMVKYSNSKFAYLNGISFGAGYQLAFIPIQAVIGFQDDTYFQFKTGLKFSKFEWTTATTFHHGLFAHAKGIGFSSSIDIKF
ncbi:MAG: hypothetical protein KAW88_04540 [Candidatus Cloacimonetes bacterium]|nr:hypothetical protein [Candidatus Cloacimonadota bacterium]